MAASNLSDAELDRANGPKILLLAGVSVFALLIALAAGVTILGDPQAGEPVATLDLPVAAHEGAQTQSPPKPQRVLEAPSSPAPIGPITQAIYAGRALI